MNRGWAWDLCTGDIKGSLYDEHDHLLVQVWKRNGFYEVFVEGKSVAVRPDKQSAIDCAEGLIKCE